AGGREARPKAAAALRVLAGHDDRAAPFAADRDALAEPEGDEQDRREPADLLRRGQAADEEADDAHDRERPVEHLLPADPVAEVPEEDAADRAGEVAGGERREARDRPGDRVEVAEEDRVEHEPR